MTKLFKSIKDIIYINKKKSNHKLGQGSFSEVTLVAHRLNLKKLYAMKEIQKKNTYETKQIKKEINLHKKLDHKNIIKFIDYLETQKKVYIFLEYASKGDLFKFLNKKKKLQKKQILKLFYQTAKAIKYLHSKNIMHRDLKPENILLDENKNIKLCDFGWSTEYNELEIRKTLCGTYEYMSPEIFFRKKQTKKTDIWALGILLYEMFHGHAPYRGRRFDSVLKEIKKNRICFKKNLDLNVKDLILRILIFHPKKRIDIKSLLGHKVFDFLKIENLERFKNKKVERKVFNPLDFNVKNKLLFKNQNNIYSKFKKNVFSNNKMFQTIDNGDIKKMNNSLIQNKTYNILKKSSTNKKPLYFFKNNFKSISKNLLTKKKVKNHKKTISNSNIYNKVFKKISSKKTQNENINIFDIQKNIPKNKFYNKIKKSLSQKQFLTKSITKPLFYKVNNYKEGYLNIFKTQDYDRNVYLCKNDKHRIISKKIVFNSFLL